MNVGGGVLRIAGRALLITLMMMPTFVSPTVPPAPIEEIVPVTEVKAHLVHVVTAEEAECYGWSPTRAAQFSSSANVNYSAFKVADTWPKGFDTTGVYRVEDVLYQARQERALNGGIVEDYILHEIGGHGALGWSHEAPNALMNHAYAYTPEHMDADRHVLRKAILETYSHFIVREGPHPQAEPECVEPVEPRLDGITPNVGAQSYVVYVVSEEEAECSGWGGAAAVLVYVESHTYAAFKHGDSWPSDIVGWRVHPTEDVLASARQENARSGVAMEDYILQFIGGYAALVWSHEAPNALMNHAYAFFPEYVEGDRNVLRKALLETHPYVIVRDESLPGTPEECSGLQGGGDDPALALVAKTE